MDRNTQSDEDDDTLSRTMTEEELRQATQSLHHEPVIRSGAEVSPKKSQPNRRESMESNSSSIVLQQHHSHKEPNDRGSPVARQGDKENLRTMGPNETIYVEQYHTYVTDKIASFHRALPDYQSLSTEQQAREQRRVLELLKRLKIATHLNESHEQMDDEQQNNHDQSMVLLPSPMDPRNESHPTESDQESDAGLPVDQSALLLSPNNNSDEDDLESVSSPLEKPRAMTTPASLVRVEKKRHASSSGKRGADTSRLRPSTSPCPLAASIRGMSLGDDHIFSSSQSPISIHSPIRDGDMSPDISFGNDISQQENDSLVETAMLPTGRVRWDFDGKLEKEAPTDVQVLDTRDFHLKALPTTKKRQVNPFRLYPDRVRDRLERLSQWVAARTKAAVLSMREQELIDLVISLHADESSNASTGLQGKLLVVCRSKEDLDSWSRSLRESSSLSVFNHATLPLRERKSPSGANKAAHFDVVLTTYDALKSPDVTHTVNKNGHVVQEHKHAHDGWHSSSQSTQSVVDNKKQQFSFLHRIQWHKVCFVDQVGRKSFLLKAGTARVQASVALNANARFLFFCQALPTDPTGFGALRKSDRSSLQSLRSVLRIPVHDGVDELKECIIDFQEKKKRRAAER